MRKPLLSKTPVTSGVYIFKKGKKALYVGKAKNLRARLRNYFTASAASKVRALTKEATSLRVIKTGTEPDSLILESQLIKKYQPPYNVLFRDDKSYFYIAFTDSKLSHVFITHKKPLTGNQLPIADLIGPFTDGASLKKLISQLRRVLPFCICKNTHNRPCLNTALGLCPGTCCLKEKALKDKYPYLNRPEIISSYKNNIRLLKNILTGRHKIIVKKLESQMRLFSKKENYEKAGLLRDFIKRLKNIWQHSLVSGGHDQLENLTALEDMKKSFNLPKIPFRIEGYDISNIFGVNPVGSMIVFTNGEPDKNQYRKFKIKTVKQINDLAMMREVLSRRINHKEWPLPDLFFIDGGLPQMNAASQIIKTAYKLKMPIIAFAKGKQEVWSTISKDPIPLKKLPEKVHQLIVYIKDEAHRFAITFHRKRRSLTLT